MKTAILCAKPVNVERVFSARQIATLQAEFDCDGKTYTPDQLDQLRDVEYIFSTWAIPALTAGQIRTYLPNLRCIFYAAGTIKAFAQPYYDCGVRIFSAWQANAVPVTEVAVAEILLAAKGYFYLSRMCRRDFPTAQASHDCFPGNYGAKIGLLGFGAIGRRVAEELNRHDVEVWVCAPEITPENEAEYGVHAASMDEIFRECLVVSNHMANIPETVGLISRDRLQSLQPYSTFINTGRGAQVDEDALIEKLRQDETFSAVLDVTYPEPPAGDSPLRTLDNVVLTSHFAGSSGQEVHRMAEYMIDEARRYFAGKPCLYELTADQLSKMA